MRLPLAANKTFATVECSWLAGAMYRRFEQLRKAGNVYRVRSKVFAAGLMPPILMVTGSDGGFARKIHKEGSEVAIKLECATVSARQSGWEKETHLTPIEQALEVDSANAILANFFIYLEACGMEWETRHGIILLDEPSLASFFIETRRKL